MEVADELADGNTPKHLNKSLILKSSIHLILDKPYVSTLISNEHSAKPLSIDPSEWSHIVSRPVKEVLQSDTKFNSVRNTLLQGIPSKMYWYYT